jgi:hypothetical protein
LIVDFFKTSGGSAPRSFFDQAVYDPEVNDALRVSKNLRQFLTKMTVILLKRGPGDIVKELDRLIKESSSVSDLIVRVILENLLPADHGVTVERDSGTEIVGYDHAVDEG